LKVPLVDYHAEVLRRRPKDWDGSLPQFRQAAQMGGPYDVPTLIAADGVHPSFPKAHQDYSPESLARNGYALRNYLTLLRYAEVIDRVLGKEGAGDLGLETWGWGPEAGGRERKDRGSEDEGQDECRTSRGAEAAIPSRWSLKLGHWSLKLGRWSLKLGRWSLKLGHWSFGGRW